MKNAFGIRFDSMDITIDDCVKLFDQSDLQRDGGFWDAVHAARLLQIYLEDDRVQKTDDQRDLLIDQCDRMWSLIDQENIRRSDIFWGRRDN